MSEDFKSIVELISKIDSAKNDLNEILSNIKRLLNENLNIIGEKDSKGDNLLNIAIRHRNKEIVETILEIIEKKALTFDMTVGNKNKDTVLHIAARTGNSEILVLLLKKFDEKGSIFNPSNVNRKIYLNAKNNQHDTALHIVISQYDKNPEIFQFLLKEQDIDLNLANQVGTPLILAVRKENIELVNFLVNAGANIRIRGGVGNNTPLHIAASLAKINIAEILIKKLKQDEGENFKLNQNNSRNETILDCAILSGKTEIVQFFLENGAEIKPNYYDHLKFAFYQKNKNIEIIEIIEKARKTYNLTKGIDPKNIIILDSDSLDSKFNKIVLLIENINSDNKDESEQILKKTGTLLQKNPNLIEKTNSIGNFLHIAAFYGNIEMMQILLDFFKSYNANKSTPTDYINTYNNYHLTPLHYAALMRRPEIVKLLIENNADVNHKDDIGCSVLYNVISNYKTDSSEYKETLGFLIQAKSIDLKSSVPFSLLYKAVQSNDTETTRYLINAETNIADEKNIDLFHIAARNRNFEIIEILIDKLKEKSKSEDTDSSSIIANMINIRDYSGQTPLHIAASIGDLKIIQILVAANNANIDRLNRYNKTPLELATENNHIEIKIFLENIQQNIGISTSQELTSNISDTDPTSDSSKTELASNISDTESTSDSSKTELASNISDTESTWDSSKTELASNISNTESTSDKSKTDLTIYQDKKQNKFIIFFSKIKDFFIAKFTYFIASSRNLIYHFCKIGKKTERDKITNYVANMPNSGGNKKPLIPKK